MSGLQVYEHQDVGEGYILFDPYLYDSIVQGAWALSVSANYYHSYNFQSTSTNNGDQLNYKAFLQAGTYIFDLVCTTSTDQGILEILIDGVSVGTIDTYAGVTVWIEKKSITGISVSQAGLKTISLKLNGKNALSSSYGMRISSFALRRSA